MGKQSKSFKMPIDVEFQADDYYGTDIDEVIIGIIKRKIHDIDEDLETAIKSSMNAIKLWTSLSNLFEAELLVEDRNTLVESKSSINSNNDLLIDKHAVYDNFIDNVIEDIMFNLSDKDDKEMLWYIYRHFESIILSVKTELKNGIGKTSQYIGTLNHIKRILKYIVTLISSVFVLLMMRYGPDEEFDKKVTAFIAGNISSDDLWTMGLVLEVNLIEGMTEGGMVPINLKQRFGGLDNWKKVLGKYGKYDKALNDYVRWYNRKRKK